jgi:hypothetical protein
MRQLEVPRTRPLRTGEDSPRQAGAGSVRGRRPVRPGSLIPFAGSARGPPAGLAILEQAISRTHNTAPSSSDSERRSPVPAICSVKGTTRTPRPASVSGCSRARTWESVSISALACAMEKPGFRRASALKASANRNLCCCHSAQRASLASGSHSAVFRSGYWNSGGMTPTIVKLLPSSDRVLPRMPLSAPNLRCQNPWLRIARASPRRDSSREKARPSTGWTPSNSKKLPQVLPAWIFSGPLFVDQVTSEASGRKTIARSSKARLRSCQSRTMGPELQSHSMCFDGTVFQSTAKRWESR